MKKVCSLCGCEMRDVALGWICSNCKALEDMHGKVFPHTEKPFMPAPTNADRIRFMSDEELAKFIEGLQCDYDSSGYLGCQHCSSYGTHHADKSNIGTEYEYLYECKDCEFENGLLCWLRQSSKEV